MRVRKVLYQHLRTQDILAMMTTYWSQPTKPGLITKLNNQCVGEFMHVCCSLKVYFLLFHPSDNMWSSHVIGNNIFSLRYLNVVRMFWFEKRRGKLELAFTDTLVQLCQLFYESIVWPYISWKFNLKLKFLEPNIGLKSVYLLKCLQYRFVSWLH